MRKSFFLCILIFMFTLTSCSRSSPEADFDRLVAEIGESNRLRNAPAEIPAQYYYTPDSDVPLFENEAFAPTGETDTPPYIEKAAIESDLDWLLRLLRTYYCGYGKFGGDEAFEAAVQNLLKDIGSRTSLSNMEYQELLERHFSFVTDNHFMIGSRTHTNGILYGKEDRPFYKKNGKFYGDSSCRDEIISINGNAPEQILKPAISLEGDLVYLPYIKLTDSAAASPELELAYKSGDGEVLTLTATDYHPARNKPNAEILTESVHSGIPTYVYEHFSDIESESAREFIESASVIKELPAAIYDLSLNSGGYAEVANQWFSDYTREDLMPNASTLVRKNFFDIQANEDIEKETAKQIKEMEQAGALEDDNYYTVLPKEQYVESENAPLLFILTSGETSSCGEYMTDACRNISNTVIIGGFTNGSLSANMSADFFTLPNSGITLNFGNTVFVWDEDYFQETRGLEPDIFLTGPDCEKRLDTFLKETVGL